MGTKIVEFCDRCGDDDVDYLVPILIQINTPGNEGFEIFKQEFCDICWYKVYGLIYTVIHKILLVPDEKRFGGFDFYNENESIKIIERLKQLQKEE